MKLLERLWISRNSKSIELELSAQELRNLFNFMKGEELWMPFQDIKAKTGSDGRLRFKIIVSPSIVKRISTDAALDAIRKGVL